MDKAQDLINHFEELRNNIFSYFYREKLKFFTLKEWKQYQIERSSSALLQHQDDKDNFDAAQFQLHQQVLDTWKKLESRSYQTFFPLIEVFNPYTVRFLTKQVKQHKMYRDEMLELLVIAAQHNQVKLVEAILNNLKENPYNENIIYHNKCKLIQECSKTYALDVLDLCLDEEFDHSWKEINDKLSKDDLLMIAYLYKNKKVPVEKNSNYFLSACRHNRIDVIQGALKNGQSLNILQQNNNAHWIHAKINIHTLQFFQKNKFNFHRQLSGYEANYHAEEFLRHNNIEAFRYLIKSNSPQAAKNNCLIRAISLNKQEEIDFLIEQGADIYHDDGLVLFNSIYHKNKLMTAYLLEKNITYHKHHQDILKNLVRQNDIELLTYFIEQGNPLYISYNNTYNLLQTACEEENLAIVQLLAKHIPISHRHYTVLFTVIEKKNVEILHCLLNELSNEELNKMTETLTNEFDKYPDLANELWNDILIYTRYRHLDITSSTQAPQKKPKL